MKKTLFMLNMLFAATTSRAEVWNVEVGGGGGNGTPYYAPQNLTINQGDEVLWTWVSGQHNVTQTSGPVFFASGNKVAPATWSFIFEVAGTYDYECTVGNHAATQFGTITVNPANQIPRVTARVTGFTLFPNPAASQVMIALEATGLGRVSVYDLTGKVALEPRFMAAGEQALDISMLSPGVYFVEVRDDTAVIRKRLTVR